MHAHVVYIAPQLCPDIVRHFVLFGRLFVKRFALCYRTIVCPALSVVLSVCNIGVLCPNGWTDKDETWHAGRPQPWPHCVRWGPSSPLPKKGADPPQFSAHIYCGQTSPISAKGLLSTCLTTWLYGKQGTNINLSFFVIFFYTTTTFYYGRPR